MRPESVPVPSSAFRLFALICLGVGLGSCIFSPSSPTPWVEEKPLDKVLGSLKTPDRVVEMFEPVLDSTLALGAQSDLVQYTPVQVQEYDSNRVVEYRLSQRRYGSWSPEREFQWNLFYLRMFYLHPETVADTAGLGENIDSLYHRAGIPDHFTRYVDSAAAPAFRELVFTSSHKAMGFQAHLNDAGDTISVFLVAPGSPAERAGLRRDAVILAIDDSAVVGDSAAERFTRFLDLDSAAATVKLTFSTSTGVESANIGRDVVNFPTVLVDSLGSVGYLAISSFTTTTLPGMSTYSEFAAGLQATRRFPVTVLDLRGNGGGSVSQADSMCEEVLSGGVIIRQLQRVPVNGAPVRYEVVYNAHAGERGEGRRFVLLADSTSASASELFIAAVQEGLKCPLVGTHTYGKAVGQVVLESPGGGVALITQLHNTTASGIDYDHIGLQPTVPSTAKPEAMLAQAVQVAAGAVAKPGLGFPGDIRVGVGVGKRAKVLDWNRRQALRHPEPEVWGKPQAPDAK